MLDSFESFSSKKTKIEEREVAGETVRIKQLSAGDITEWSRDNTVEGGMPSIQSVSELLAKCVVDAEDKLIFDTEDKVAAISEFPSDFFTALFEAVADVCGMNKSVEDAVKN